MAQQRTAPPDSEALRPVVAAALGDTGLDLEDIQLRKAGSRVLLRILVDRDGGLTLDDAAEAARRISRGLDESGAMGERSYVLDVGSPGVDRPLTLLRHWQRNIGRLVRITAAEGALVARIDSAAGPAPDQPPSEVVVDGRMIPFAEVRRAVVQVEFGDGGPED